jgi:membrane associated rhomboid family serine protease
MFRPEYAGYLLADSSHGDRIMGYVLLLAVALTIAYRSTSAAERRKYLLIVLQAADRFILRAHGWWCEIEPFRAALRTRTPIAPMTPLIAAINVAVVLGMFFHPRLLDDPNPLISWGASFGPRTANGEWWRLFTTLFVHSSLLDLMVNLLALVPLGLMLERIVGPMALTGAYLTAGLFSSLFTLSVFPIEVSAGATGAVAGLYAFMLVVSIWGISQRPRLVLPMITVKGLAICGGLFAAYAWLSGSAPVIVVGFGVGLLTGLTVGRGVNTSRTPAVRMAATVAGDQRGPGDGIADISRLQDGPAGLHGGPDEREGAVRGHRPGHRAGSRVHHGAAGAGGSGNGAGRTASTDGRRR